MACYTFSSWSHITGIKCRTFSYAHRHKGSKAHECQPHDRTREYRWLAEHDCCRLYIACRLLLQRCIGHDRLHIRRLEAGCEGVLGRKLHVTSSAASGDCITTSTVETAVLYAYLLALSHFRPHLRRYVYKILVSIISLLTGTVLVLPVTPVNNVII